MVRTTAGGRQVVTCTMDPSARAELKKRGIPVGVAAEFWIKNVDRIKEKNTQFAQFEAAITRLQNALTREATRTRELEDELAKLAPRITVKPTGHATSTSSTSASSTSMTGTAPSGGVHT